MVTENVAAMAANVFFGFFPTAYGSSIPDSITLTVKTVKFAILIWTNNSMNCGL